VVDHGRSQAVVHKKLFVSKTDYKLNSRTLTWEVRDRELQVSAWVSVQNQNRLQQIHGKKACLRMLVKATA